MKQDVFDAELAFKNKKTYPWFQYLNCVKAKFLKFQHKINGLLEHVPNALYWIVERFRMEVIVQWRQL